MFSIYYPADSKVKLGDVVPFGKIRLVVIGIKGPSHFNIDEKERYLLTVKKI